MAVAIWMVPFTISGGRQFGSRWRNRTRHCGSARHSAASIYSRPRSTRAAARAVRAYRAHSTITSASITFVTPLPSAARIISATRMAGNDNCRSTSRMIAVSVLPPA